MGPRVLTAEQISAYVDGELTPQEMQEVRFQAEDHRPSQRALDASLRAHEALKSIVQQVKSDPAYARFQDLVRLHDFSQVEQPSDLQSEFEDVLNLFPDRSGVLKLLYEVADLSKGSLNVLETIRMELRFLGSMRDRGSESYSGSEPPPAMSMDFDMSPAYSASPPMRARPEIFDRIEELLEIVIHYSAIASLYEELAIGKGSGYYNELVDYCYSCVRQSELEDEEETTKIINRMLAQIVDQRHPLGNLLRNAFNDRTSMSADYRSLLEAYIELVRIKENRK